MNLLHSPFFRVAACLFALGLAGCGGVSSKPTFPDAVKDREYKQGSLVSDEGGFNLFGGPKAKETASGLTVNAYLWRAALDTIAFMPLASADPFGGTILTDWYSAPGDASTRTKLNVFILDRELRADGVRVKAFKQVRNGAQGWVDTEVGANVTTSLEDTILTRARQMKVTQKLKDKK